MATLGGMLSLALLLATHPPSWLRSLVHEATEPHAARMVAIPGGEWQPLFDGTGQQAVTVASFYLDRDPVTNGQFLGFVRIFFNYRRGRISKLFADEAYLSHWVGPSELGDAGTEQPVTNVSWFAARAYCAARGARLPSEMEWEYAASAGERQADGASEPGFLDKILTWYARPTPNQLARVGRSQPNYFGIRDLHGLVWEWVLDFNGMLVTSDSRAAKGSDVRTFCGAGALGFRDSRNYAAFMRAAFRSSLSASYTAKSLGFRCARDLDSVRDGWSG